MTELANSGLFLKVESVLQSFGIIGSLMTNHCRPFDRVYVTVPASDDSLISKLRETHRKSVEDCGDDTEVVLISQLKPTLSKSTLRFIAACIVVLSSAADLTWLCIACDFEISFVAFCLCSMFTSTLELTRANERGEYEVAQGISASVFRALLDFYKYGKMRCPANVSVQELRAACDYMLIPFSPDTVKCDNLSTLLCSFCCCLSAAKSLSFLVC